MPALPSLSIVYFAYVPSLSHAGAKRSRAAIVGIKEPKTHEHTTDSANIIDSVHIFLLILMPQLLSSDSQNYRLIIF
jgi:hypothetical protein